MARAGQGDWEACPFTPTQLLDAAKEWRSQVRGLQSGWLCWNVDADWCFAQQLLVESVGWVPIVGFDPRIGPPNRLTPNALVIDFNRQLKLPIHYPHIPIELAFAWIPKLAFWHADFLANPVQLACFAEQFLKLHNAQIAAVPTRTLKTLATPKQERFWELLGCTTAAASLDQWENGCGWWMNFWKHPNYAGGRRSEGFSWDHGGGIRYWEFFCKGRIKEIPLRKIESGHFSVINNPNYVRSTSETAHYHRNLGQELSRNYALDKSAKSMGIDLNSLERRYGRT
jgi:hypothetical protein